MGGVEVERGARGDLDRPGDIAQVTLLEGQRSRLDIQRSAVVEERRGEDSHPGAPDLRIVPEFTRFTPFTAPVRLTSDSISRTPCSLVVELDKWQVRGPGHPDGAVVEHSEGLMATRTGDVQESRVRDARLPPPDPGSPCTDASVTCSIPSGKSRVAVAWVVVGRVIIDNPGVQRDDPAAAARQGARYADDLGRESPGIEGQRRSFHQCSSARPSAEEEMTLKLPELMLIVPPTFSNSPLPVADESGKLAVPVPPVLLNVPSLTNVPTPRPVGPLEGKEAAVIGQFDDALRLVREGRVAAQGHPAGDRDGPGIGERPVAHSPGIEGHAAAVGQGRSP